MIGLGRFGTSVATTLTAQGNPVVAVDSDPVIVARLANTFERIVVADTTDEEALEQLDVSMFSRAVVAIGTDQESSILTTSLLAEANVEEIWAKALSPQHARILRRVGAHRVVLPEQQMGARVAHLVHGDISDYYEVTAGWLIVKSRPPQELVGVPLSEVAERVMGGVSIVALKPQHADDFRAATPTTRLTYGDEILVMGTPKAIERFTARA